MQCLDVLGFMDCYYLDIDKIYNAKRKQYMTEIGEYRYKIRTTEGTVKSITIKEIYKRLYNQVFCKDDIERLEGEEFREIEGTEGNYLVSNYGRVISYISNHAIILKPTITPKGYERLQITIEGQRYNKFVHSLVAAAWLGQPQSLEQEIHHKDFNQRNNNYTNLQYVNKNEHVKKHIERRKKEQCQTTTVIQTKEA
ncbi:MAG: NUMOD4 motif-containing HNH endonuclease [Lachnospiraceae bacterium]|nr:NUMOD4 motif-containing HNH endonuclease [Lachnospiraceae bacterium]